MGIPKFYRWLSERYPLLNQKLTLTEGPPEMDNLYLDMNGIIHNCTHANRKDLGGVTEEDMMLKVFTYLEKLVQIVRPQKLLFMAIDGVAPRAKMNQQRSRRFKSALERQKNEEEMRRKGETVQEDAFDSNVITPGTEFMARLGKHLRFFIRRKVAEDPLWQKPTIVFSGHEVPGEGEHKIMEYIRWEKRQPSYQPNQRHCMYGLDADLIMLSLVSHEPHFCLLREVVSYTGSNRGQPAREVLDNPCAENFILFQIGLLREYFELEFGHLAGRLPFALDVERVVDDYVLMCMLVGNDFLPALPTMDIAEGALNKLMELYKELLPAMGGYVTHAGELDRRRLEMLMARVGQMELQVLEERAQDAEFMENKREKRAARMAGGNGNGMGGGRGSGVFGSRNQLDEVDAGIAAMQGAGGSGAALLEALESDGTPGGQPATPLAAAVQQQPTMMSKEARALMMAGLGEEGLQLWKNRYYGDKMHALTAEDRRAVLEHYVAGLHWVLEYYYRGVASWDWYYPYHYAPMASDMVNLDSIQVAFSQGTPFRPFEQLLAVLPAASARHLPVPFRDLMLNPNSPIIDFYPPTFEVDMEGKRADWEGVVLVPFVDETRLLEAAQSVRPTRLTAEELARNQMGQIQIFQFSRNTTETSYCHTTMPKHFKDIKVCHSRCVERPPPPPLPPGGKGFVPSLVPGTRTGLQAPAGMPTLKSLQVRPTLRNAGINVLGTPSRKESVVLALKDLREALGGMVLGAEQVARSGLLGARCYINWPYLQEARVVRVSDRTGVVTYDNKGAVKVQKWQGQEVQRWETDAGQLGATFLSRCGIDVGKVDLVVGVKVCLGYIRHADGTVEKTYSKDEVQVPLQAVIRQRPQQAAAGAVAEQDGPAAPVLHEGMQVVFLGKHHYGCMATVLPDLGAGLTKQGKTAKGGAAVTGHLRLLVQGMTEQVGVQALRQAKRVVERFAVKYYNSGEVAGRVGMTPRMLGRIAGNMWTRDGDDRYDLGLAIKTSSREVCVPGFSQPTEDGNGWMYSAAVINILADYKKLHPWVWQGVVKGDSEGPGDLRLDALLPGLTPQQRKDKVREVTDWLKSTPLAKRPLVKLGTKVLSDEGVRALQTAVSPVPARPPPPTEYENVPPSLVLPPYTPGADQVKLSVQGGAFELGDRVVCVSGKGNPPYGLIGTVIGVYEEACEVVFDEEFSGGSNHNGRVNGKCGAFVPLDLLLCINKPANIVLAKHQVPRQAQAQAKPQKQAGAPPAADAAARAAQKALQQAPASGATGACVPAGASCTAPLSPPVPSSKLLGAAMRSIGVAGAAKAEQPGTPTQPAAPALGTPAAGSAAGQALLQKLNAAAGARNAAGADTSSNGAAAAPVSDATAAAAAAAAASAAAAAAVAASPRQAQAPQPAAGPNGLLQQLQQLAPQARVGSSAMVSPRAAPEPQQRPPPQSPQAQPMPPGPHMGPPPQPVPMPYPGGPPPQHFPPGPGGPPPHMMMGPMPYGMPPPHMMPPGGPMHPPHMYMPPGGYPPMGMPPHMGPPMGAPMAMPHGGPMMMGPPPPHIGVGMPPPPRGPGPQGPPPPAQPSSQPAPPPQQQQQRSVAPQQQPSAQPPQDATVLTPPQQAQADASKAAPNKPVPKPAGGAVQYQLVRGPPKAQAPGQQREGAKGTRGAPKAPAQQQQQQAENGKPKEPVAVAATAAAPHPSPMSHPIEIMQSMEDSEEVAAMLRRARETPQQQQPPAAGTAPAVAAPGADGSGGGAAPAAPAVGSRQGSKANSPARALRGEDGTKASPVPVGKNAKLPDAVGKGFTMARGRPPVPPPGVPAPTPAAPGSQPAEAVAVQVAAPGAAAGGETAQAPSDVAALQQQVGRLSLDGMQAGKQLLLKLQGGAAAGTAAPATGAPPAAAGVPNPGALLLRQLQQSGASGSGAAAEGSVVDAALKAQSLDSGSELLRQLQLRAASKQEGK